MHPDDTVGPLSDSTKPVGTYCEARQVVRQVEVSTAAIRRLLGTGPGTSGPLPHDDADATWDEASRLARSLVQLRLTDAGYRQAENDVACSVSADLRAFLR